MPATLSLLVCSLRYPSGLNIYNLNLEFNQATYEEFKIAIRDDSVLYMEIHMTRFFHLLSLSLTLALSAGLLHPSTLHAEDLPEAIKKIEAKGAVIIGSFAAPEGMRGYAARYQNSGMALYLTPDGKHVLLGTLYDADGKDMSSQPLRELVYAPMAKEIWGKMKNSNWIADGVVDAPRIVYLFTDPNCPYCNMFWEQARPWVNAGKVQLRHIMVGIIREDSAGKSASLLASKDSQNALANHEKLGKGSTLKALENIPPAIQAKLQSNLLLMQELEVSATPAIFYMDDNGVMQQQQGAPSPDKLEAILGPK